MFQIQFNGHVKQARMFAPFIINTLRIHIIYLHVLICPVWFIEPPK